MLNGSACWMVSLLLTDNTVLSTWCHFLPQPGFVIHFFCFSCSSSPLWCVGSSCVSYSEADPGGSPQLQPQTKTHTSVGGLTLVLSFFPSLDCLSPLCRSIVTFSFLWRSKATYTFSEMSEPTWDFVVFLSVCLLFPSFFLPSVPWRLVTGMKHRAVGRCGILSVAVRQVCPQC